MSEPIKRILLVEDEFESQFMIDLLLSQYQCQVDLASDGLAALHKACTKAYDCILMDLGLPRLDGIQTFITIKKIFKVHALTMPPVIALTEFIDHSLIEQCFELGMASVLFKPLKEHHINRLFARLKQLEQREMNSRQAKYQPCLKPGLNLAKPVLSGYSSKNRQTWKADYCTLPSEQVVAFSASIHENQALYQTDLWPGEEA